MSFLKKLLEIFHVEVTESPKFYIYTRDENDCKCCPTAIEEEGCDCICKEDQVIIYDDGQELRWRSQQSCSDWNCSYCH